MPYRLLTGLLLSAALFAGCQGTPPQVVYVVVTPTQDATAEATPELLATEAMTEAVEMPTQTIPAPLLTTVAEVTADPAATLAPTTASGPTALPPNYPTPVVAQVQIAEQLFEHGRMFWVEPVQQIWVLKITGEGQGTWSSYADTFVEGEAETDPSLVPPDGRYQPERGFGKLWREAGDLRQELGWGITPEFGYISQYEYHAGGSVDASGQYVRGPGYHIVFSLASELFRLNEDGTWQLGNS
jgi:hypothetical protein